MVKNIFRLIERTTYSYPQKIFLKDINKQINFSYDDTLQFIYKFNNYLSLKKIKKREKIIVVFDNSVLLSLLF